MPVIVFDSYDATGKTNYAEALSYSSEFKIPPKFTSQLPEFKDPIQHAAWSKAQYHMLSRIVSGGVDINMIMDRWIMTEYCYSPVLRGYDIEDYYWDIDKSMGESNNLLWVYPSIDGPDFEKILRHRFIKNNETYVTVEQTYKIRENYEKLFRLSSIPRVRIDTSSEDPAIISFNINLISQALHEMCDGLDVDQCNYLIRGPLREAGVTGK